MGIETMIVATLVQGAMSYGQGQSNASSIRAQDKISQLQNEFQREMLEEKKADLLEQGDKDVFYRQEQLKQMLGSQKVAFAAQGIEIEGELGAQLEGDARKIAREDAQAIKNNAWKQSMGVELDQEDLKLQNTFNSMQANARAADSEAQGTASLINAGVSAYNMSTSLGKGAKTPGKKIPGNKYSVNYNQNSNVSRIS